MSQDLAHSSWTALSHEKRIPQKHKGRKHCERQYRFPPPSKVKTVARQYRSEPRSEVTHNSHQKAHRDQSAAWHPSLTGYGKARATCNGQPHTQNKVRMCSPLDETCLPLLPFWSLLFLPLWSLPLPFPLVFQGQLTLLQKSVAVCPYYIHDMFHQTLDCFDPFMRSLIACHFLSLLLCFCRCVCRRSESRHPLGRRQNLVLRVRLRALGFTVESVHDSKYAEIVLDSAASAVPHSLESSTRPHCI